MYNKSKQWKTWRPQWIYPTERPLFIKKLWVSSYLLYSLFLFFILTGTSFNAWALAQQLILTKRRKEYRTSDFLCTFSSYFFIFSGYLVLWTLASAGREPTTTTNYNVCVHVCTLVYVYLPVLLDAQKHKHISFFFFYVSHSFLEHCTKHTYTKISHRSQKIVVFRPWFIWHWSSHGSR